MQVPEGWRISNLKNVADIDSDSLSNKTGANYSFKYIDIASVKEGIINSPKSIYNFAEAPSRARRVLKPGDVLMSTVRPNLKAFAYFDYTDDNYIASTGFSVIRASKQTSGKFLLY